MSRAGLPATAPDRRLAELRRRRVALRLDLAGMRSALASGASMPALDLLAAPFRTVPAARLRDLISRREEELARLDAEYRRASTRPCVAPPEPVTHRVHRAGAAAWAEKTACCVSSSAPPA